MFRDIENISLNAMHFVLRHAISCAKFRIASKIPTVDMDHFLTLKKIIMIIIIHDALIIFVY